MKDQTLTIRNGNLRVELDREEHYPDDPGAGFPAMVYLDVIDETYSATYTFAIERGFLQGPSPSSDGQEANETDWTLTTSQYAWLDSLKAEIDAFLPPAK